jgi:hypothetical protein
MTEAVVLTKRGYVSLMRLARQAARPFGVLDDPPPPSSQRLRHWLRSLLAIHDVDELIRLDVPWWTYDAIARVESFLARRKDVAVFEYGSGASTVWLAKRAARVTSVDHDRFWVELLSPRLAGLPNVSLELVEPDAAPDPDPRYGSAKPGHRGMSFRNYVTAIDRSPGGFDLIVIDGRARSACLLQAIDRLADDGLIVFDNSHRRRYRDAILGCGLDRMVTRGLVPSLPFPDQTTLLRRPAPSPAR